ncbi:MAG: ATP-binding cassette domain-containing protein [Nitrospirae bacterium]|nr:MAG: ATP-binding cassette domain-containing protein [Nitrospirota bacterium]
MSRGSSPRSNRDGAGLKESFVEHTHPHHEDHYHGKPLIRFDHATFRYPYHAALEDITFEIEDGEFIGIIGPNGSGKTTLLRAILGLLTPVRGGLQIFDCACQELRCHHRARIGYLPQKGSGKQARPRDRASGARGCWHGGRHGPAAWITLGRPTAAGVHRTGACPASTGVVA